MRKLVKRGDENSFTIPTVNVNSTLRFSGHRSSAMLSANKAIYVEKETSKY